MCRRRCRPCWATTRRPRWARLRRSGSIPMMRTRWVRRWRRSRADGRRRRRCGLGTPTAPGSTWRSGCRRSGTSTARWPKSTPSRATSATAWLTRSCFDCPRVASGCCSTPIPPGRWSCPPTASCSGSTVPLPTSSVSRTRRCSSVAPRTGPPLSRSKPRSSRPYGWRPSCRGRSSTPTGRSIAPTAQSWTSPARWWGCPARTGPPQS